MKSSRATPGLRLVTCRGCGQDIHFVQTTNGRRMPCNDKKLTVVTLTGEVVSGWEPHWRNCPGARRFRKPKQKERRVFPI